MVLCGRTMMGIGFILGIIDCLGVNLARLRHKSGLRWAIPGWMAHWFSNGFTDP